MYMDLQSNNGIDKLYVVFEDNTTLWWLRFLKKGFRHCYILAVLEGGASLLELNPMSNQIIIKFYDNLKTWEYIANLSKNQNRRICEVRIASAPLKCAPAMVFTCVEFVKRVLGIHQFSIITPYKLFKVIHSSRK